jgi:hypothetical protein
MYRSYVGVYGLSKPSSWSPIGAWFTPTASLVGSGVKLGTDPQVDQPACCGLCREQWDPSKSVDISQKVAICGPREIRMVLDYTRTECGKRGKGVHQFESPRLSDMSNRLFVVVIT